MPIVNKYKALICALIFGAALAVMHLRGDQMGAFGNLIYDVAPTLISSESFLRTIEERKDMGNVYDAYYILAKRNDPIAISHALQDLNSKDAYLWLNAASYLGKLQRSEAIPYLIKALRHSAYLSAPERAEMLQAMTGEPIGVDFVRWREWHEANYPDSQINWESFLGPRPVMSEQE